ncbi:MAG TPA: hypothetical protein VF582_09190, partial [Allosphingosinicella sp.]
AIVMVASIVKARYGYRHRPTDGAGEIQGDSRENERLREEVTALKDRLAVLERITIEKENSLEREIEQLRDR